MAALSASFHPFAEGQSPTLLEYDAPHATSAYRPLVVAASAVAMGVCADRVWFADHDSTLDVALWLASCVALSVFGLAASRKDRRFVAKIRLGSLLIGAIASGAAWHHAHWNLYAENDVGTFAAHTQQPICVEGVALGAPRRVPAPAASPYRAIPAGDRSQLMVQLTRIRRGQTWQPLAGEVRLRVNGHLTGIFAGDRLRIFAQCYSPSPPQNPGDFDYAAHLRAERRLAELQTGFPECVTVLEQGASGQPSRLLDRVRTECRRILRHHLSADHVAVAAAVVLGAREGLTRDETQVYMSTGTVHVLVVSGLHVGILATAVFLLSKLLLPSRTAALWVTAVTVVLFTLLAEARPPAVRACNLTLVTLLALGTGRRGVAYNALAAAGLVTLANNPSDLFRAGPQLSFLAVATLIWCGRRVAWASTDPLLRIEWETYSYVQRMWKRISTWGKGMVVYSFWLWAISSVLVAYHFHLISPAAFVIGPLAWVLAWSTLISGFLLVACGWIFADLAQFAASVCDTSIGALSALVDTTEAIPLSHMWIPGPSLWWVIGTFTILGIMRRLALRWNLAGLAVWLAVGLIVSLLPRNDERSLTCTFISVGHGTSVLIETPDGRALLYDGGSLGSPERAGSSISACLWSTGRMHVDAVVLSHADVDHYNALPFLLDRFSLGAVFVSPVMFDPMLSLDVRSAPEHLQQDLADHAVEVHEVFAGDSLRLSDELQVTVLHPPEKGVIGSDNANSIVLLIEYDGRRILLPGDLESPGLDDLLAELPTDVDILLAPHHGSRFSNPVELARWSTPEWVVVSGGSSDLAESTTAAYQDSGATVLHTAEHGAVRFIVRPAEIACEHWSQNGWQGIGIPKIRP